MICICFDNFSREKNIMKIIFIRIIITIQVNVTYLVSLKYSINCDKRYYRYIFKINGHQLRYASVIGRGIQIKAFILYCCST